MTGAANLFDAERERAQRRLRRADEEIERLAALAERERIARDLHDLLGRALSLIVVKSSSPRAWRKATVARWRGDAGRRAHRPRRVAEVRAAVVGYRSRTGRELDGARRALDAAGVEATIECNLQRCRSRTSRRLRSRFGNR